MGRRERRDDRERDRDRDRDRSNSPDVKKKSSKPRDVDDEDLKSASNKQPPKSRVEVHQPTTEVWDYENHWQREFNECCDSCSMWACAFFCTPCFVSGFSQYFFLSFFCCQFIKLEVNFLFCQIKDGKADEANK